MRTQKNKAATTTIPKLQIFEIQNLKSTPLIPVYISKSTPFANT